MVDVDKRASVIDDEEKRAARSRLPPLGAGTALAALLFVLAVPSLYRPTLHGKLPFDRQLAGEIDAKKPDYVFIGNSMLARASTNIRSRLGSAGTAATFCGREGRRAHGPSALKNEVIAARIDPKWFSFSFETPI